MSEQPQAAFQSQYHPIFRLPPELLSHVFWISLQSERPQLYDGNLTLLRLVCKKWNELVERSPALWSFIDTSQSVATIEWKLTRSGTHPLVILSSIYNDPRRHLENHEMVLHKCLEELQRCISLTLTIPAKTCKQPLVGLFARPAPLLRLLSLRLQPLRLQPLPPGAFVGDVPQVEVIDLFGDHAPSRLNDVVLDRVKVKWNWPTLPALRTLHLKHVHITILQLVDLLAASPTLESLNLELTDMRDVTSASQSMPIELPRLAKLDIAIDEWESIKGFLQRITAPAGAEVVVNTAYEYDPEPDTHPQSDFLLDIFSTALPRIFPIKEPVSYSCTNSSAECVTWYLVDGKSYSDTPEHAPFSMKVHGLSRAWPFILEFHRRCTEHQPCFIRDWCPKILPHIEILFQLDMTTGFRFDCGRDDQDINTLFEYFERPHSFLSSPSPRWLFPKLRVLYLDRPTDMGVVAAMIKRRYAAETSFHDGEPLARLNKLQIRVGTLRIVKNLSSGMADLKGFLGDNVVSFQDVYRTGPT